MTFPSRLCMLTVWMRLIIGIVMLLTTSISAILNLLIVVVMCRTNLVEQSVRPHIASVIAANLLFLSSNCCLLLPAILGNAYIRDPYNIILTTPNTIGYLLTMFTTTTMAIDRFLIFFQPKGNVLSRKGLSWYLFTSIPCLLTLLLTTHMNIVGCYKRYLNCGYIYDIRGCGVYRQVLTTLAFASSGVNFIIYLAIFFKIRSMNLHAGNMRMPFVKKRDVKLVAHFSIICVGQFIGSTCYYILPRLLEGWVISFQLTTFLSSLNTMTYPCVMIAFQENVRRVIRTLLSNVRIWQACSVASITQQRAVVPFRINAFY